MAGRRDFARVRPGVTSVERPRNTIATSGALPERPERVIVVFHMTPLRALLVVAPLALCLSACSSTSSEAPAARAAADSGTETATSEANLIKFTMDVKVEPGTEVHRCQIVRMPKAAASDEGEIFIGARSHEYTPGSHHYLIFRTDLTEVPPELSGQVDCFEGSGIMKYVRGYVAGGQVPKETVEMPAGVAIPFKSEEILIFQAHYVNAGKTQLAAKVNVQMTTVPKATVQHRAGITNFYNPFIYVPAKSIATANMSCPFTQDVTVLGAGPHMHRRGVLYKAFLDEPGKRATEPFYTTDDWEHPLNFTGPLVLKAGARVRFECHYANDTENVYVQGQSAETDEMCMFSAIYYPAMELADNQCRNGMSEVGSGTTTCSEISTCARACPPYQSDPGRPADISPCVQKCVTEGCASSTAPFVTQIMCLQKNCAAPCKEGPDTCRTCMTEKCPSEALACIAHKCP